MAERFSAGRVKQVISLGGLVRDDYDNYKVTVPRERFLESSGRKNNKER